MDYEEFMSNAPKDCQPTVVNNQKDYEENLKKVARELGKKVEDLTPAEKDKAYYMLGLCPLDYLLLEPTGRIPHDKSNFLS